MAASGDASALCKGRPVRTDRGAAHPQPTQRAHSLEAQYSNPMAAAALLQQLAIMCSSSRSGCHCCCHCDRLPTTKTKTRARKNETKQSVISTAGHLGAKDRRRQARREKTKECKFETVHRSHHHHHHHHYHAAEHHRRLLLVAGLLLSCLAAVAQTALCLEIISQREPGEATSSLIQGGGLVWPAAPSSDEQRGLEGPVAGAPGPRGPGLGRLLSDLLEQNGDSLPTSAPPTGSSPAAGTTAAPDDDDTPNATTRNLSSLSSTSSSSSSVVVDDNERILTISSSSTIQDNATTADDAEGGNGDDERFHTVVRIADIIIYVTGLCGNTVVILVILKFTKIETVTDIYILNLAFADLMFIKGLLFLIITMYRDHWIFGDPMCKLYMASTSLNQFASSLLLVVMSFDRFLAVCHPIYAQRFRRLKRAKIICLCIWIICLILMTPILAFSKDKDSTCAIFWPEYKSFNCEKAFVVYSFSIGFTAPLLLIAAFYLRVIRKLRSAAIGAGSIGLSRRSRTREITNRRIEHLVIGIICTYTVCWLPYWVAQLAVAFTIKKDQPAEPIPGFYEFYMIATSLSYTNSALNPILYAFLSDNFKRRCSDVLSTIYSIKLFQRGPSWSNTATGGGCSNPPPATTTATTINNNNNNNHHHHHHHHHPSPPSVTNPVTGSALLVASGGQFEASEALTTTGRLPESKQTVVMNSSSVASELTATTRVTRPSSFSNQLPTATRDDTETLDHQHHHHHQHETFVNLCGSGENLDCCAASVLARDECLTGPAAAINGPQQQHRCIAMATRNQEITCKVEERKSKSSNKIVAFGMGASMIVKQQHQAAATNTKSNNSSNNSANNRRSIQLVNDNKTQCQGV